jgi:molecular chaperone DnaK (HSP70)
VQAAARPAKNLTLLEEPQAALTPGRGDWRRLAPARPPGDVILVVDVGGGTSDFR